MSAAAPGKAAEVPHTNGSATNGTVAGAVAAAALRVCSELALPDEEKVNLDQLFASAFGDAGLVDEKAGPKASLIKACRRAMEMAPPAGVERERKLDFAACEVVSTLWLDPAFREAWGRAGHGEEVAKKCPLREIAGGARFALVYGDSNAQRMYFTNFARLSTHASMMSDDVRTNAYYRAIMQNKADFEGKVVMDVGSGSGILAFFAVQAGAAKVYCVEASRMERVIRKLADANGWTDKIVVVNKVLQDIRDEVPEKVDAILSETLGNCLFAERGIETVIIARERFLKPGGKLYPCKATFLAAPFSDESRHRGLIAQSLHFWTKTNFYGVDMSSMQEDARDEVFKRPLGDNFHPDQLKAEPVIKEYDFRTLRSEELAEFSVDFDYVAKDTCVLHGIAAWFEAHFEGTSCQVILSTSPWDTLTHWWHTRLMLREPLGINAGQKITGGMHFVSTEANTYDVRLVMEANGAKRVQEGMSLLDLDTNNRDVAHKEEAVTTTNILKVPDYTKTKASPTGGPELVKDPMVDTKLAAARSEATALRRAARESGGGPKIGAQIKVNDAVYVLVDEPELLVRFTSASSTLQMVGQLDNSIVMTPQGCPQYLVQYAKGPAGAPLQGSGVPANLWMETNNCIEHIKACLLANPAAVAAAIPGKPNGFTAEEVPSMKFEDLISAYEALRLSAQ